MSSPEDVVVTNVCDADAGGQFERSVLCRCGVFTASTAKKTCKCRLFDRDTAILTKRLLET